jgi:hypothetical protein
MSSGCAPEAGRSRLPSESRKSRIDLADRARAGDLDLQSDLASRFIHVSQGSLGSFRIGRVDQHGKATSRRDQLTQQF